MSRRRPAADADSAPTCPLCEEALVRAHSAVVRRHESASVIRCSHCKQNQWHAVCVQREFVGGEHQLGLRCALCNGVSTATLNASWAWTVMWFAWASYPPAPWGFGWALRWVYNRLWDAFAIACGISTTVLVRMAGSYDGPDNNITAWEHHVERQFPRVRVTDDPSRMLAHVIAGWIVGWIVLSLCLNGAAGVLSVLRVRRRQRAHGFSVD